MTAVGLFAGRGDVVLAMGLAVLVGMWAGYQLHKLKLKLASKLGRTT